MSGWMSDWSEVDQRPHAYPLNDLMVHQLDMGCACQPVLVDGVVAHHALDGRESEDAHRRPNS